MENPGMPNGAFTDGGLVAGIDLPLILVIAFFLFFLCLIYYLRQEDKREGYPLQADPRDRNRPRVDIVGFPPLPTPKKFLQPHGRDPVWSPRKEELMELDARRGLGGPGMPFIPNGDPLLSGMGPGSWMPKVDEPDLSFDGEPIFRPLRWGHGYRVAKGDADPRGFAMLGCDKNPAGEIVDIWIDIAEHHARFLEIRVTPGIWSQRVVANPVAEPRDSDDRSKDIEADDERTIGLIVREEHIETPEASVDIIEVDRLVARDAAAPSSGDEDRADGNDGGDEQSDGEQVDPAGEGELGELQEPLPEEKASHDSDEAKGSDEYEEERLTPPREGHILVPMEFVAVNGRARTVRTSAITAAQFANVPGRKSDLMVTAREENQIRGYFGGGYLYATAERTEPWL